MRSLVPAALALALVWPAPAAAAPSSSSVRVTPTVGFVRVDGHRIAYRVIPGHSPAIVLDAGGGEDSSEWSDIAPRLAKATGCEVVTYDRAGMGASDPVPGPWDVLAARDDLAAVMAAAGATRGAVLVPHSLAGEVAFFLADQHPQWIAGAVLVDANVPEFFTDPVIAGEAQAFTPMIAAARAAPPTPATRQLIAMSESYVATSRRFHGLAWPRAIPAIVIVSAATPFEGTQFAPLWTNAQAQFASEASNRTLVIAAGSSHEVPHDKPDVVIGSVVQMVAQVRTKEGARGRRAQ